MAAFEAESQATSGGAEEIEVSRPGSEASRYLPLGYLALSLLLSYGVIGLVVWSLGLDVTGFFKDMFLYPLTTQSGLSTMLRRISPILLSSLTLAFAFRIGFWNVGSPGQLMVGMIAGTWVAIHLQGLPWFLHVGLTLTTGFGAGALLGLILAYAKFHFGVNEVLLSLLLNFVSQYSVTALLYGPMQGRPLLPYTAPILPSAELPRFFGRVHVGVLLAITLVLITVAVIRYTRFGYMMRVMGSSMAAARAAGIDVVRVGTIAVCVSAGFSGLAGVMEVTGVYGYGFDTIVQGIGFYGMISAFIAFGRLGYLIPAAVITSMVLSTGELVKAYSKVLPSQTPQLLLGLIAFGLLLTTALGQRASR